MTMNILLRVKGVKCKNYWNV